MEENTGEEQAENPKDMQEENLAGETITPKETETMEVHHHPDLHHKPKKWKEYLLEGLMIFLAVTMGFFAEGLREHIGDKAKEKEYMRSLVTDLRFDTTRYQQVANNMDTLKEALDSSYSNIKDASRFNYVLSGKWQYTINQVGIGYRPGLTTIQQMKSSGNLRLVENKEVSNKIMEYEALVDGNIERANDNAHAAITKIYAFEDALCDYTNFREVNLSLDLGIRDSASYSGYDMPIIDRDVLKLNEFANSFINYKAINKTYKKTVMDAKEAAADLIVLINKEYGF